MVKMENQSCRLSWMNEEFLNGEIFHRNLVVGGNNGSSTPTFICKIVENYDKFAFGQYNREERVCYIPVGDQVYPFTGYGIQLLINDKDLRVALPSSDGDPPSRLSGIAGSTSFTNPGRRCSNQ